MKSFVIIGLGRFGSNLALTLANNGNQVLAIDSSEDRVKDVADFVTDSIIGDYTDDAFLRSAGVKSYDCAVVCLSEGMEKSILVTLHLKDMGLESIVSRAIDESHERILRKVGATKVVFPERDSGERLAHKLEHEKILDYLNLSKDFSITEIETPKKWIGKSIGELNIRKIYKINIIAINSGKSSDKVIITIDPDYILRENQTLTVVGRDEDIERACNG